MNYVLVMMIYFAFVVLILSGVHKSIKSSGS